MSRNYLIIISLLILAIAIADAKVPKVGDHVIIHTNYEVHSRFEGQITAIEDEMICLDAIKPDKTHAPACIGIGTIVLLEWSLAEDTQQDDPSTEEIITVYLTVHDGSINGAVLPGVRVTGSDGSGKRFDQITNSNGITPLKGSSGKWHFEASMDGYQANIWDQELVATAWRHAFLIEQNQETDSDAITGHMFNKGDRIRTTNDKKLNVRTAPGTSSPSIGTMIKGSLGTILDGPVFANNLYWWKIEYDEGISGWSSGKWLELAPEIQLGCNEDPVTGKVICRDDLSIFSQKDDEIIANQEPKPISSASPQS